VIEVLAEDMSLQKKLTAPLPDIITTTTTVGTGEIKILVIGTKIVDGKAVVLLIAAVVARGGTVKSRTVTTPMIRDEELHVTPVKKETVRMRKLLSIILILFIKSLKVC